MNNSNSKNILDRRTLLGTGSAVAGSMLLGCGSTLAENPQLPAGKTPIAEFKDQGYRIYGVKESSGKLLSREIVATMDPAPEYCIHLRFNSTAAKEPPFLFAIWANEKEAAKLSKNAKIKLIKKSPEHVIELGDVNPAEVGVVAVKFFPNTPNGEWKGRSFATLSQIRSQWQNALRDHRDVKIRLGVQQTPSKASFAELEEQDQIIIEFDSPELMSKISKLVKEHPQTLMIQWGAKFTYCYCPGCGMG